MWETYKQYHWREIYAKLQNVIKRGWVLLTNGDFLLKKEPTAQGVYKRRLNSWENRQFFEADYEKEQIVKALKQSKF